jgi:hypothetical protein
MSTVSTINGKPHAQLARQVVGLTTTDVKTPCAILIETIIRRLLGSGDELSQIVMQSWQSSRPHNVGSVAANSRLLKAGL